MEAIFLQRYWPPAKSPSSNLNQLGGLPNLPPELPWPRATPEDGKEVSLDFLAQINLVDLPDVAGRDALPASGMLYFFALALVNMPIAEYGPGAACVVYWPGDAANVPPREIPPDAGWRIEHLDYGLGVAESQRFPDAPRGVLFPRCPIRLSRSVDPDTRPEARNPWTYRKDEHFPRRVEDAVLSINFVRNAWYEGLVPLSVFLGSRIKEGFSEAHYDD